MNHTTKHEQIIKYIEDLNVGQKISVRQIAKEMEVSEGTAYRAIKEAENKGIVSTKERIGTVRIEKSIKSVDQLTFEEVVKIVDGKILGGAKGLEKTLNKFVIGAMELNDMVKYIDAGSLLIVGNRNQAQFSALKLGAGVLVTGGFQTRADIKQYADQHNLPIISSKHDTYTVASMLNRAIYDRMIKKKIILVSDIVSLNDAIPYLKPSSTVEDWQYLLEETGQERFAVVDDRQKVIGIVTTKDVMSMTKDQSIDRCMTKNPITVTPHTSIASCAYMMVGEGIDVLPVVDHNKKLLNVIGRQDVLKAMQFIQEQPETGETFEDQIWSSFSENKNSTGKLHFKGIITPQMANQLGTVSEGVLTVLITKAAYRVIKDSRRGDLVLDNISSHFLRPLQIENEIELRPSIVQISRKAAKVEVEIYDQDTLVCKAMVTTQMIEQP
ncbi:DRTGG domain-containing protein [Longirhabdus pacifica]|uniref:DRTGG domain-containing protein n=1 Tax=Longirhabdus pacifica TaxID=2305227 RepID=UPI001F0B8B9C|nr:DRTGG domain-containing protein [Longirhabdus pacifica]